MPFCCGISARTDSHITAADAPACSSTVRPTSQILSDASWKCKPYEAYQETGAPYPNWRLPESNIRFDARKEYVGWTEKDAKPNFYRAVPLGKAGIAPWNNLVERPIPLWKDYGIQDYPSIEKREGAEVDTFYCKLPYNCQANNQ